MKRGGSGEEEKRRRGDERKRVSSVRVREGERGEKTEGKREKTPIYTPQLIPKIQRLKTNQENNPRAQK